MGPSQLGGLRGWCWGSFGGGAGGTVVGEMSDSFSMLHQSVSRGSWGSRCASGSETAGQTARHDSRTIAYRGVLCSSNTSEKHGQPGARSCSTCGAHVEAQMAQVAQVAQLCQHGRGSWSLWRRQRAVQTQQKSIRTERLGPWTSSP